MGEGAAIKYSVVAFFPRSRDLGIFRVPFSVVLLTKGLGRFQLLVDDLRGIGNISLFMDFRVSNGVPHEHFGLQGCSRPLFCRLLLVFGVLDARHGLLHVVYGAPGTDLQVPHDAEEQSDHQKDDQQLRYELCAVVVHVEIHEEDEAADGPRHDLLHHDDLDVLRENQEDAEQRQKHAHQTLSTQVRPCHPLNRLSIDLWNDSLATLPRSAAHPALPPVGAPFARVPSLARASPLSWSRLASSLACASASASPVDSGSGGPAEFESRLVLLPVAPLSSSTPFSSSAGDSALISSSLPLPSSSSGG
eukprot:scaffold7033_cov257-Pinguiococcus_pyrenoidosus.AAC.19